MPRSLGEYADVLSLLGAGIELPEPVRTPPPPCVSPLPLRLRTPSSLLRQGVERWIKRGVLRGSWNHLACFQAAIVKDALTKEANEAAETGAASHRSMYCAFLL